MAEKKAERKQECVQVVVRCRPFSTKETKENRGNIIAMDTALFQVGGLWSVSRLDEFMVLRATTTGASGAVVSVCCPDCTVILKHAQKSAS